MAKSECMDHVQWTHDMSLMYTEDYIYKQKITNEEKSKSPSNMRTSFVIINLHYNPHMDTINEMSR